MTARIKPQQFRLKTGIKGKIMLWASVGILVSGMFPPWSYTYYRTGTRYLYGMRSEKHAGYYFILNPPPPEVHPVEDSLEDTQAYGVKLDVERLLVEWVCILAASGIAWSYYRPDQEKSQMVSVVEVKKSQRELKHTQPTATANLAELWTKLVAAVGRVKPILCSYLVDAKPISFNDRNLVIGFSFAFEDRIALVDNARNHTLLQEQLAELGYANCQIQFVKMTDFILGKHYPLES